MALLATALIGQLAKLFTETADFPTTVEEAGRRWAAAYRAYAQGVMAGPTVPVDLQAAESTLAGALAGAFTAGRQGGDPVMVIATAFVTFWFAPPVNFAAPPITGVVTTAIPGQLPDALRMVFTSGLSGDRTGADQAQALADALDAWTRTVLVTNTTPAGPVTVPLT